MQACLSISEQFEVQIDDLHHHEVNDNCQENTLEILLTLTEFGKHNCLVQACRFLAYKSIIELFSQVLFVYEKRFGETVL